MTPWLGGQGDTGADCAVGRGGWGRGALRSWSPAVGALLPPGGPAGDPRAAARERGLSPTWRRRTALRLWAQRRGGPAGRLGAIPAPTPAPHSSGQAFVCLSLLIYTLERGMSGWGRWERGIGQRTRSHSTVPSTGDPQHPHPRHTRGPSPLVSSLNTSRTHLLFSTLSTLCLLDSGWHTQVVRQGRPGP